MTDRPDHVWVQASPGRFPLDYRKGSAFFEDVRLADIADGVATPTYVYSAGHIRGRYAALSAALRGHPHHLHYAVKANSSHAVLAQLARLGAGADIVSGGELERARAAGFLPTNIVFSGVGKTTAEIDAALAAQIRALHVESPGEVEQILARARAADTVAAVAIRVNPDIAAQTHPYLATGLREAKFGVPFEDVLALARTIARHPNGRLVGLASHIGSQLRDPTPYVDSLKRLVELAGALASEDIHVEYLDLGGGLGVAYGPDDVDLDVIAWGSAIVNAARGVAVPLLFEPGRFLVANAGLLLTRVIGRKQKDGRRFVIVDAGMNDLIRPALYGAYHAIVPIEWPQAGTTTEQVDIVGPVCESGDFLARSRLFPTVQPGDLLAVLSAGAYGMTMASTYNSRPLPAEVLVDGDRSAVVRRRSSVQELMANESPPPWFRDDRSPASTQQPVNPDESTEREK